jgi:hypothetical protein
VNASRIIEPWLIITALLSADGAAQSVTGDLSGHVVDETRAVIPGVTVTVTDERTSAAQKEITNERGAYRFVLMPGGYRVSAAHERFQTVAREVTIHIGTPSTLDLVLHAALSESVTVGRSTPRIETTRSQTTSVVDQMMIEGLPTNSRNFIDFALTTPGVVRDPPRPTDLSFAGQRGTMNSIIVDGTDNNNTFFAQALGGSGGRSPYQFSIESVQEFQVNSSSYSAEYGRAGGAVINVVTRSGSNEFHGSAFEFLRDRRLNANDYINTIHGQPNGPYRVDQLGLTLSGPLVRDKHFFFAVFDAYRNTQPNPVVINLPASVPDDPDTRAGIAKLQDLAFDYVRRQDQRVSFVKTDNEFGSGRLSLRYNRQDYVGQNLDNFSPTFNIINAFGHTGAAIRKTDTLSISHLQAIRASVSNELRAHYARDREPGTANSSAPEAIVREAGQTVLMIGRNFINPRETTIWRDQLADSVTALWRDHTFKAGVDLDRDEIFNFFSGGFSGSYTFNSIASFYRGRPNAPGERYVQAFGIRPDGDVTRFSVAETALFVQDQWPVLPNLTLNLGLRFDGERVQAPGVRNPDSQLAAAGIDTSRIPQGHSIAPRLGFAYTPGSDGRTVVRGGYGLFYVRSPAQMIRNAVSLNGITVQTITFTGEQVPTYPDIFSSIPQGALAPKPDIFIFSRDYRSPRVDQASLGIDYALSSNWMISMNVEYAKGEHLQRVADTNVGESSTVSVPVAGGSAATFIRYSSARPISNFGRVMEYQSSSRSDYRGVTVGFDHHFSHDWAARFFYTYALSKDDKPEAVGAQNSSSGNALFAQDAKNLAGEYGWSNNDVRHRAVLVGIWNLPQNGSRLQHRWERAMASGWSLSAVVSYQTGQPYSAVVSAEAGSSADLNNDGNNANDRAPGFPRNAFRVPSQFSFDPRVTRSVPLRRMNLELIGEAFNLFNNKNVSAVDATYYRVSNNNRLLVPLATFGSPTASSGPRILQLGAKLRF